MTEQIERVIKEIQDNWMAIDGVVGVGSTIVDGEQAIMVIVELKTPIIESKIPSEYKGFKVKFIEGGEISIQNSD